MTEVNDQSKEQYLLKTGIVLSAEDGIIKGVYHDDSEWTIKVPPELHIYPNSKVRLYRYALEDEPDVSVLFKVLDKENTHSFIIGVTDNQSEGLIRFGIEKTTEQEFYSLLR